MVQIGVYGWVTEVSPGLRLKRLLCMLCSNQDPITPPLFYSKRMSVTIHQHDTKVCSDACNRNKTYKPRKEFNAVCLKKRAELHVTRKGTCTTGKTTNDDDKRVARRIMSYV